MKKYTAKRDGLALGYKTFHGKSGKTYLVFKALKGSYHVFTEVEAKEAARDCGTTIKVGTPREMWKEIWDSWQMIRKPAPAKIAQPPKPSLLELLRKKKVRS